VGEAKRDPPPYSGVCGRAAVGGGLADGYETGINANPDPDNESFGNIQDQKE